MEGALARVPGMAGGKDADGVLTARREDILALLAALAEKDAASCESGLPADCSLVPERADSETGPCVAAPAGRGPQLRTVLLHVEMPSVVESPGRPC